MAPFTLIPKLHCGLTYKVSFYSKRSGHADRFAKEGNAARDAVMLIDLRRTVIQQDKMDINLGSPFPAISHTRTNFYKEGLIDLESPKPESSNSKFTCHELDKHCTCSLEN